MNKVSYSILGAAQQTCEKDWKEPALQDQQDKIRPTKLKSILLFGHAHSEHNTTIIQF